MPAATMPWKSTSSARSEVKENVIRHEDQGHPARGIGPLARAQRVRLPDERHRGNTGYRRATVCRRQRRGVPAHVAEPILIHSANAGQLSELVRKASTRDDIACAIYTEELFDTYNDEDNRAEVAKRVTSDLNLVGVALWGKKNPVDRLTKGLPMHE